MSSTIADSRARGAYYVLGHSGAEQDRLIRQAMLLAPFTERLFRDAGIGAGQRVLDVGSGVGDVSMVAARLVGPSGEVVGVERDASYVARARERVAALGLRNVTFVHGDVTDLAVEGSFDAAVGRMVLSFLPDPVAVLRSLARVLVPGGAIAFHEPMWSPALAVSARVPLWSQVMTTIHEIFKHSRATPDMGLDLCGRFEQAGLPAPRMHVEIPLATDSMIAELQRDLLRTLLPAAAEHGVSMSALGDLDTLPERVHAAALEASSPICFVAMVGAWAKRPG